MDVVATPQLHEWLNEHAEQIIARWTQRTAEVWPEAVPALATIHVRRIYETLLTAADADESATQQQLQALGVDWQSIGLTPLVQMAFQLRPAVSEVVSQHINGGADSGVFAHDLDRFIERAVVILSQRYNDHVQAELREQVIQAEYLVDHQAQMASESDYFALQLSTLYELSQTLSATLDRETMLDTVGPGFLSAFNVESCALLLRTGNQWRIERAWGGYASKLNGRNLAARAIPAALQTACNQGTLQLLADPATDKGDWLLPEQGVLFVPLSHDQQVMGALVAQSPTLIERIDDTLMNLWRTVANQIVVTLENTRLYQEVQNLNSELEDKVAERTAELSEERDRLEAIADIARDISTLEINVLLNRILQALASLTGVQHGSVMLIDPGTGLLVDRAVLSETMHTPGSRRFQLGEGVVGWIAQHRQPALVNDVRSDERWVAVDAFGQTVGKSTGSLVGMPLIAGDDVVGVLMLSHPQPNFFNQSHMRLLKAIAGEIAIAIYNAQLYEYLAERSGALSNMLRRETEVASQNNAILQSLNDAVIVFSTDRSIILANPAAERILERPLDELLTQNFDDLLVSLQIELPGDPLGAVLANSGNRNEQSPAITIKRGAQSLSVSLVPVVTEKGDLIGACLIGRDITREVESDRLKTEFIGTVSHELRTPMTSIKGYTQLLAMGSLGEVNATQKEFLTTISTNAERMIAIINDLLDITKIETGSVELHMSRLHIAEVLSGVVSSYGKELSQRKQELTLNLSPSLPLLWSDQERLRQVVHNVLTNAIKYTPHGGKIDIRAAEIARDDIPAAQRETLPANRRYVAISVRDSGVGIDPSELDRIFERFYRTENPLKIEAGGTGLGLSLVRPLLILMGGRIWVESTVGEGSTFTFVLPAPPDE
jgi:signal transduction histidine kinase